MAIFNKGFTYYEEDPDDPDRQSTFMAWIVVFVLMVVIFGFIIGSLFVAAVVTNLDKAMLEQCESEKRENEESEDYLSGERSKHDKRRCNAHSTMFNKDYAESNVVITGK